MAQLLCMDEDDDIIPFTSNSSKRLYFVVFTNQTGTQPLCEPKPKS